MRYPCVFANFRKLRTPHELIQHMDSVLGYARTSFVGGRYRAPLLSDFRAPARRECRAYGSGDSRRRTGILSLKFKPETFCDLPASLRSIANCPVLKRGTFTRDIKNATEEP